MDTDTETLPLSTLSGLPVADRRQSWAGFRGFGPEGSSSDLINLIVSVEDTGSGIPLEAQSRIFMPFMQVAAISRTHGGTGIGLSISKCLVHLMKGEIGFASVPKIGSTFTFTAVFSNANEQKNHQISKASIISIPKELQGMSALVVDFRTVRAEVSKYHVQRLGINVEVVADLDRAFSRVSNGNTAISMVLIEEEVWDMDMGLSDIFTSKLKGLDDSTTPQVFLLANSVKCARVSVLTSGVSSPSIIMKPLRAGMLAASLQRAMGVGGNYEGELSSPTLCNLLDGRKILVVDDNKVNLKVAEGFLKKYGAEVVCAESGQKAVSLLQPPHEFDACFMDIQMPEMDG